MSDLEELTDMYDKLRELIPAAHAAVKDLRDAVREARDERTRLLAESVEGKIRDVLAAGLADLDTAMTQAVEEGVAAVDRRFSVLEAILLGEDPKSARAGKKSIPDIVADLAARASVPAVSTTGQAVPPAFRKAVRESAAGLARGDRKTG